MLPWLAIGGLYVGKKIIDNVPKMFGVGVGMKEFAPALEDEVTVEVVGQPGASKKQLYFLALAAAFDLVRRRDIKLGAKFALPPPGMLMIEYDAADHWIRATIRYKTSMIQEVAAELVPTATTIGFVDSPVYAGPRCDVIGQPFEFTGTIGRIAGVAGIPDSSADPIAPKLPFAEKTILTPCAKVKDPNPTVPGAGGAEIDSPNPKPPGDNRSRGAVVAGGASKPRPAPGSVGTSILISASELVATQGECCLNKSMSLVPVVFAALTDPGSYRDETFTPPVGGPLGV